jgi:hypothetical protein
MKIEVCGVADDWDSTNFDSVHLEPCFNHETNTGELTVYGVRKRSGCVTVALFGDDGCGWSDPDGNEAEFDENKKTVWLPSIGRRVEVVDSATINCFGLMAIQYASVGGAQ